ncbi:Gmad2 immunoglobulin-like domain-containing protein [Paenibacillus arenilitoris]|uniref:Bacterial spore germination immunoglobulin-like domain-containing protein n=1 Tax=Paenibacillus arenilitoris TaxID=2772299 RepID=A0A927CL33_9BACL|nr:Gmad2 immunoglobulin-like domain-containing protein [Paenibacillus arenilitoris]MBD2868777.1 hypothetical protein [Paenibacillus arenilitoris]
MGKRKRIIFLALLCIASLLTACGLGSNGSTKPPEEEETEPVQAIDKGYLIRKDESRWFITSYKERDGNAYIDAYSFAISDKTAMTDSGGRRIAPDQIPLGAQVDVWNAGPVAESYPMQTDAAKIVLHADTPDAPEDGIGRTEAIAAALETRNGAVLARAVKTVELDTDNGYWDVELAEYEMIDQPIRVRVDSKTGEILPVPVAENEAFRVFAPQPGSESGPTITVEGEARVFEAAFSWTLEDGHNVLAEGHEMADGGAPAWGKFKFDVNYENASQSNIMFILFVHSAKDGSVEHQLVIPLKAPEELIQYKAES